MKHGWKNIFGDLRVHVVTGGLIDDEQGCFKVGRGYVDHIFTLKQKVRKHKRKYVDVCEFCRFGDGV